MASASITAILAVSSTIAIIGPPMAESDPQVPPIAALEGAVTRDDIAAVLLSYAALFAPRIVLLGVRGGALLVLDGRGVEASMREAGRVSLPLTPPSTFTEAVASGKPFRGRLGTTPVERGWIERLGSETDVEVLLLPIVVREKSIALLYADGWQGPLADVPLYAAAAAAGRGYQRLILLQKQKRAAGSDSKPPRTETPAAEASAMAMRADPRYAVALDCLLMHDGTTYSGESRDLSRGGLCARLDRPVPVGAEVDLHVSLVFDQDALSEAIRLPARVVWCTRHGGAYQVGTKFGALDDDTRQDIDLFLRFLDAAPAEEEEESDDPWA
jgi:hypothetical protein